MDTTQKAAQSALNTGKSYVDAGQSYATSAKGTRITSTVGLCLCKVLVEKVATGNQLLKL